MQGVARTQWYLFNDFHITPLKEVRTAVISCPLADSLNMCMYMCMYVNPIQQEVGVFPTEWFTPCILVYAQCGFDDHFDTKSVFC